MLRCAPDILAARTPTATEADRKLYSGLGNLNYQAQRHLYGPRRWGLRLVRATAAYQKETGAVALGDRDRIKPDTGELEPATGQTQQGRVRDDRGNWFGCDNSNLLWHYPLDEQYLRRNPHVAYPNTTVNVAPSRRLYPLKTDAQRFPRSGAPSTVTAACGLGIYRDDLLGPVFRGNSFTCEPVHLLIHRLILKPNGSTFAGVRAPDETESEFLASTDNWSRFVHAATGPDGGLWVADMYRFVIEHPRWIPPEDLAKVDVRAGAGLGRIYRVRLADKPVPVAAARQARHGRPRPALESRNGWRDMAMMMLIWKNDATAKEPLEKLVRESKNGLARMQAVHARRDAAARFGRRDRISQGRRCQCPPACGPAGGFADGNQGIALESGACECSRKRLRSLGSTILVTPSAWNRTRSFLRSA